MNTIPLNNPHPDINECIGILKGTVTSSRVPLVEYIIDVTVMKPIIEDMLERPWAVSGPERDSQEAYLDNTIQLWYRMGYDFIRFEQGLGFQENKLVTDDTAQGSESKRAWVDQHHGCVTNWDEFESYKWPKIEDFDFFPFEYLNSHLPEGMGLMSCHGGGILEHLSSIMSYETLCFALVDAPDLVQAVTDRVGSLLESFYTHLLDLDNLSVLFQGDDMGFKTGTLISPDDLRKYTLPWHAKFANMAHEKGIPYFLHSCGQLELIMEDLIETVKIDGKHSYEDTIIPVEEFHQKYGNRVAVLGGIDLNILSGGTPEDVRARTRELMETCGPGGRYAIGSGNSVPSYVPVENYLAMVDEVHSVNGQY